MALVGEEPPVVVLGAFDGLGGSGARIVSTSAGEMTSAAFASRLARKIAADALAEVGIGDGSGIPKSSTWGGVEAFRNNLQARIQAQFSEEAEAVEPLSPTSLRGTLSRRLPTTLSMIFVEQVDLQFKVSAIWAGDTRAYIWCPGNGLMQITRDHSRNAVDALSAVREDSPMDNFVNADKPFFLDFNETHFRPPFLFFVCSDGAYNYFPSPMEFELVLLESIASAGSWQKVSAALTERIVAVTKDDATLALSGLGWRDAASLRTAAKQRYDVLAALTSRLSMYSMDLSRIEAGGEALACSRERLVGDLDAERLNVWQLYRGGYEGHHPAAAENPGPTALGGVAS